MKSDTMLLNNKEVKLFYIKFSSKLISIDVKNIGSYIINII